MLKKAIKTIGIMVILIALGGLVLYWRLTSLTIAPGEVLRMEPIFTLETDRFKIDIPESLTASWHMAAALDAPIGRIVFNSRPLPSQATDGEPFSAQEALGEDVSDLLGRPAKLAASYIHYSGCLDISSTQRIDPSPDSFCPKFELVVIYPQERLVFTYSSGFDHHSAGYNTPAPQISKELRADYMKTKKEEFLLLVKSFLEDYVPAGDPDPPATGTHYHTSAGFVRKNASKDYTYTIHSAYFRNEDQTKGLHLSTVKPSFMTEELDIWRNKNLFLWKYWTGRYDHTGYNLTWLLKLSPQWRIKRDRVIAAYNHYPFQVNNRMGEEFILKYPYFSRQPQLETYWFEDPGKDPEKMVLHLDMAQDTDTEYFPKPAEAMGLWRSILNSVEFREAPLVNP